MRSISRVFFSGSMLVLLGAGLVSAQTAPFDFNLLVTLNGNTFKEPNDTQIPLTAQVGTQASASIIATYTGATQATIAGPSSSWVLGSTQITVTVPSTETFPLVLNPGQSLTFTVTFAPPNASGANAIVQIPYTEPSSTGGTTITNDIVLSFTGTSPTFSLYYALAPNYNSVSLAPSGTIPFPATQINTTALGDLLIVNSGSGPGVVTGISLAPSSVFSLSGTPVLPFTLTPGTTTQNLEIGISYTPTAVQAQPDTGQITITYQGGATATVNLTGSGATSTYTYTYINGSGTSIPLTKGGTITLPPVTAPTSGTAIASSNVIVKVTNSGNANGVINSINAVPSPPFAISGAPVMPPTLAPGGSENFSVTFTPTQVGTQTGTLVVGNDTFILSGTGLGPQLTFSYVLNGTTIPVASGGAVAFPSVAVGKSEEVNFIVTNSGTSNATIVLISTSAPFSVPVFSPITLAAGKSTSFAITFTPTTVGPVTGALLVNSTPVSLEGAGDAPATLPSYTISGPSGNVQPATQPNISLTLSKEYSLDLTGTLTISTEGNFGTDSSVQFDTGSRTVDFTIPANTTSADFAGQGTELPIQTGTVAETVTLTPTFETTGGLNVTPSSPPTLQFTIPSAAPVLEYAQVTNETTNGFDLVLTGYSTTRSLNSLNVTFTPATGFNIQTSIPAIDLSQVSTTWFSSSASQSYGGQFQITEEFVLQGTVSKSQTLIESIASVTATVSNGIGTSNSISAPVQ